MKNYTWSVSMDLLARSVGAVHILPEWTVIQARSAYTEGLTVKEAEYHGQILCLDLLSTVDRKRVVFCGDSNLAIRQKRDRLKGARVNPAPAEGADQLKEWPDHELVHVKRDWNGSANSLVSAALQRQAGSNYAEHIERGASGQEGGSGGPDHGSDDMIGPANHDTDDFRSPIITGGG
ncbi:LOW QUALITY PROTEIN: Reverse transcriptase [Phytophthora palmivora]|uniref:Reverse transcriptase n=1 Tax=Phytophthora palmivora TaxID=4796 RepID=A0A2P4YVQ1_9STRA|nr:LOW QUALITY PROTEIN: Reverse transcriptase [Phytophthora palmivora]